MPDAGVTVSVAKLQPSFCATLAVALFSVSTIGAQLPSPKRPQLPDGADPNDPVAYIHLAEDVLQKEPETAAAAYYWAARLNPLLAEAYYGRRVALLLSNPPRLMRYLVGDKDVTESSEALALDSLYAHALALNPFLGPHYEILVARAAGDELANHPGVAEQLRRRMNAQRTMPYLFMNDWESDAIRAYDEGRYIDALRYYGKAISKSRDKAALLSERGRLFYQIGMRDSALTEVTRALQEMRARDAKDVVVFYNSKALMEQRIGVINRALGNDSAARDAFGAALQEDLSYFPAHVELGYLALEAGDTTAALAEMQLAVDIRPDDSGLRSQYGLVLAALGRLPEGEKQLLAAIELNPDYAAPHFVLAHVYHALGKNSPALAEYRSFLRLAPLSDQRRENASEQIQKLGGTSGSHPIPQPPMDAVVLARQLIHMDFLGTAID